MKIRLLFSLFIGFMYGCTTKADQIKTDDEKLYYSYQICENVGKCKKLVPSRKDGNYIFKRLDPTDDEFYIKYKDKNYFLYYKNVYSEDVQAGWAKANGIENSNELSLDIDKINLALGGIDFVKNGYANKQAESKNYKIGIYNINENYQGAPYYQKQKITFKKIGNDFVLDCKSYLSNPAIINDYSGIFYGVCSDNKKVYFKQLK